MYRIKQTPQFESWLANLPDRSTRIRLSRRLVRAQRGLLGDVVFVGKGVFEMREFFGPGWRMYYTFREGSLLLMLWGGNKDSQSDDVNRAIALADFFEE